MKFSGNRTNMPSIPFFIPGPGDPFMGAIGAMRADGGRGGEYMIHPPSGHRKRRGRRSRKGPPMRFLPSPVYYGMPTEFAPTSLNPALPGGRFVGERLATAFALSAQISTLPITIPRFIRL